MLKNNAFILFITIALIRIPLIFNGNAEYGGADGEAEELITELNESYKPWFSSIWEPPSGEIESLLFVLQGAAGAGFIGYFIGYMRGRNRGGNAEIPK